MKIKTLLLLGLLFFNVTLLFNNQVSANECDYIDEEGYCVTIVDNSNGLPSIGETDEDEEIGTSQEKVEVEIDTEIPVIDKEYDNIGNVGEYKEKEFAVFKAEYLQIAENSSWMKGDEQCFIDARANGSSYTEAYRECFKMDLETAVEEVGELFIENKDYFSNLFEQMNSDSFKETITNIYNSIKDLFTSEDIPNTETE